MVAAKRQAPHDLFGQDAKRLSRLGQRAAVRVAIDARRADPVLERADAAAERRLGQVARFGRAGKIAFISELDEVLEPHDIIVIPLFESITTVPPLASFEPLTINTAP